MTSENREQARTPSGAPQLRTAPIGTKLKLRDQSIVEIIGNPGDGGWVNVRYLESPSGSPEVGAEEWVFVTDVRDFAS